MTTAQPSEQATNLEPTMSIQLLIVCLLATPAWHLSGLFIIYHIVYVCWHPHLFNKNVLKSADAQNGGDRQIGVIKDMYIYIITDAAYTKFCCGSAYGELSTGL